MEYNQEAKSDKGKIRPTLVPRQIIRDIAVVREYGDKKYGSTDNWKQVEIERYRDALCRHLLAYLDDPKSVDEESGISHYKHMACNTGPQATASVDDDGIQKTDHDGIAYLQQHTGNIGCV